jgi:hypothetical protein
MLLLIRPLEYSNLEGVTQALGPKTKAGCHISAKFQAFGLISATRMTFINSYEITKLSKIGI